MSFSTNALSAKVKTIYGNRITSEKFRDLSTSPSLVEVITYLKSETTYKSILHDIPIGEIRRRQLEELLKMEYFQTIDRLLRYVPKKQKSFYYQEVQLVETMLLLDKVVHIIIKDTHDFTMYLPAYLYKKLSFNMYELLNIETYTELVEYLRNTKYYKVLRKHNIETMNDYELLEKSMMEFYYDCYSKAIKDSFSKKVQKELLELLYTSIELKNINKIYRLKKYYEMSNDEIINKLSMQYTRLSKEFMSKLITSKDAKEFLKILNTSKYQVYSDDKDYVYIEYSTDNILYHVAKRKLRFNQEAPIVFMTYCILKKIEIDNLKHIIEGVRYQKDSDEIERLLIVT